MKTKLTFFLFVISSLIFAQSANNVLKKIQNKFNSINNFTANFSQNYFNAQGHDVGKANGKFSYKRKNKFIVDLKSQLIISDGQTIWNNDKRFNRVVISNLSDDPTSFSLEQFIFDYPPLCKNRIVKDETVASGEVLIEMIPKDQNLQFKVVKIWVSAGGMVTKLEIVDRGEMQYAFQFSEIKINQDLPNSRFTFTIPKGIQVIDLR